LYTPVGRRDGSTVAMRRNMEKKPSVGGGGMDA
jgi:hypothetical protein